MFLDIVLWILLGAIAGWIASIIMGTNAEQGALLNIVVGIVGAFIGGLLLRLMTGEPLEGLSIGGLATATLGAVILLGIVRLFSGGTTHRA